MARKVTLVTKGQTKMETGWKRHTDRDCWRWLLTEEWHFYRHRRCRCHCYCWDLAATGHHRWAGLGRTWRTEAREAGGAVRDYLLFDHDGVLLLAHLPLRRPPCRPSRSRTRSTSRPTSAPTNILWSAPSPSQPGTPSFCLPAHGGSSRPMGGPCSKSSFISCVSLCLQNSSSSVSHLFVVFRTSHSKLHFAQESPFLVPLGQSMYGLHIFVISFMYLTSPLDLRKNIPL